MIRGLAWLKKLAPQTQPKLNGQNSRTTDAFWLVIIIGVIHVDVFLATMVTVFCIYCLFPWQRHMAGSGSDGTEDSDSSAEREQTNSSESEGNVPKRQRLTRASTRLNQSSQGWQRSLKFKASAVFFKSAVKWQWCCFSLRYSGLEASCGSWRISAADAHGKCAFLWVGVGHFQSQRLSRWEPGQGPNQQRLG